MKKYVKKLLAIFMVLITLFMFILNGSVQAAKLTPGDGEFYYTGTTKGTYTVTKGTNFWEWLVNALGEILDFLLGLMLLGPRMVFIGWTALFEIMLTNTLKASVGDDEAVIDSTQVNVDSNSNVTVERIIFNKIPLFDINIFNLDYKRNYTGTGERIYTEEERRQMEEEEEQRKTEERQQEIDRWIELNP